MSKAAIKRLSHHRKKFNPPLPYQLVLTTVASRKEGKRIAQSLLKSRLAACVNISSRLESHYRWKGKIAKDSEYLLFIKTKSRNFSKLEKAIRKIHAYSVPEIIAIPIQKGSRSYLSWLKQEII